MRRYEMAGLRLALVIALFLFYDKAEVVNIALFVSGILGLLNWTVFLYTDEFLAIKLSTKKIAFMETLDAILIALLVEKGYFVVPAILFIGIVGLIWLETKKEEIK